MQVPVAANIRLSDPSVTGSNTGFLLLGAVTLVASAVVCVVTLRALLRWAVIDLPNERSSHTRPTPRGGGLGFMVVVLVAWTLLSLAGGAHATPPVIAGATAIATISFVDDLRGVPLAARFAVQVAAVFLALTTFPSNTPILADFLPPALDRVLVALAWLWFINLFNFMDGIDGIAAGEAAIIAFGLVALSILYPNFGLANPEAITVGSAVLGFLLFNWPPARVFMGDVGSAGLGYLLGWLLLVAAAKGALVAALLLPLYFVVDASTTLLARVLQHKPLFLAHRDHAYQHAVDKGMSQASVSSSAIGLGLLLIALAVLSASAPVIALGLGLILTAAFIAWLRLR